MRKTFTFNGRNSSEFGLFITGAAVHDGAAYDYEFVEVPGRNGDLILDNGRFHNIEIRYPAFVVDPAQMPAIRAWLLSARGYHQLNDDYNPAEYREACFAYSLQADPFAQSAVNFDLVFNCKPQRFSVAGSAETGDVILASVSPLWGNRLQTGVFNIEDASTVVRIKPAGDLSGITFLDCRINGFSQYPALPDSALTTWQNGEYVDLTLTAGDNFYFQLSPAYKWQIQTDRITGTLHTYTVKAAETVDNMTPYTAAPVFVIRGVNDNYSINPTYDPQFIVNGLRVRVLRSFITEHDGRPLYIDSELQDCYYIDASGARQNANGYVSIIDETSGDPVTDFPVLNVGTNEIIWAFELDTWASPLCAISYVPRWYTI